MRRIEERMNDFAVMVVVIVQQMERSVESGILAEHIIKYGSAPSLDYISGRIRDDEDLKTHGLSIIIALCETNKSLTNILEFELHKEPGKVKLLQEECKKLISLFLQKVNNIN